MDDVTRLVSSGDCVKIWDSGSMATLDQFSPHSNNQPLSQVCWTSNNQYLVSASSSGDKLVLCSLKTSAVPVLELGEGKRQTHVSVSMSSQYLVSGGLDQSVHIWDLKTRRLHRSLKDHKEEVTCVSFNSSDSFIASGSTSGDLVLHSLTTNLSSKPFGHGASQPIRDLRLSPLKRSLLGSVSDSGRMVLWDSNTQKELQVFEGSHKAPASSLVFSPASPLLCVSVGLDKKIMCYDTASKIVLRGIRADAPLTAVDFLPDGTGVVVGSTQGRLLHYDLRNSSAPSRVTQAHLTSVTCLRFQSAACRPSKANRTASTAVPSRTRLSSGSAPSPDPAPPPAEQSDRRTPSAGGVDLQQDKFNSVGRNSLDVFSPAREATPLSREGEGQPSRGRASLDIFSPVREGSFCGPAQRKTPLGTPLGSSANHGFSPLSVFPSQPIREEEPTDPTVSAKVEGQTTPTSATQTNQSQAPPVFSPEPSVTRTNGIQAQLTYDTPLHQAPPPSKPGTVQGVASSLSSNIVEALGAEGGAPLSSLQIHFIQNMIQETLEDFRDTCHRDVVNLQVEMVRQFYIQLNEIHSLMERYSVNESLVEEIERLKEENRRLRTNY